MYKTRSRSGNHCLHQRGQHNGKKIDAIHLRAKVSRSLVRQLQGARLLSCLPSTYHPHSTWIRTPDYSKVVPGTVYHWETIPLR